MIDSSFEVGSAAAVIVAFFLTFAVGSSEIVAGTILDLDINSSFKYGSGGMPGLVLTQARNRAEEARLYAA
jgi:hypothetical protein